MILCIKNKKPKDYIRKLLELINELDKVEGYRINTQKFIAVLHINNKLSEREIKEIVWFTVAWKRIKYLGINLFKEVEDLYLETIRCW